MDVDVDGLAHDCSNLLGRSQLWGKMSEQQTRKETRCPPPEKETSTASRTDTWVDFGPRRVDVGDGKAGASARCTTTKAALP